MPLVKIDPVGEGRALLGLWQMTESVGELPHPKGVDMSDIHAEARIKERLTTYALLTAMAGEHSWQINHLPSGSPTLKGWNISISHTRGWLAVILSTDYRVAVDVEYQSDRVNRIVERFIRPDEMVADGLSRLINWCAKETAYKFFTEDDLEYFEMRLKTFTPMPKGQVEVENLKKEKSLSVSYVTNNDFVLTWAVGL